MSAPFSNQPHQTRPPMLSYGTAAGLAYATQHLLSVGQTGSGLANAGALVTGGLAARAIIRGLDDRRRLKDAHAEHVRWSESRKAQGNAGYATVEQIQAAGLYTNRGFFLGTHVSRKRRKRALRSDSDQSVNVTGPAGSIKSLSIGVNTLLMDVGRSYFVNDPSAEMLAICGPYLLAMGHRLKVISPWADQLESLVGFPVTDAGFDLYGRFDPASGSTGSIITQVMARSERLLPRKVKETQTGNSTFFNNKARGMTEWSGLYLAAADTQPSLPKIRRLMMEGNEELERRLVESTQSSAFGGVLAERAAVLLSTLRGAPEQFQGMLAVAEEPLSIWDHWGELGRHCAGETFDPRTLKDDRPTTVFLIYPKDKARTHQAALNLTISQVIEEVASDPRGTQVSFLLDEISGCGYLSNLLIAMDEYRKYGCRFLNLWQELHGGQAEEIYGKTGLGRIVAAGQTTIAMGVRQPETCKLLSEMSGQVAVDDTTYNDTDPRSSKSDARGHAHGHKVRPLLYPDEIRRLDPSEALIFHGNTPLIRARRTPYWEVPALRKIAGVSPYYRKGGRDA